MKEIDLGKLIIDSKGTEKPVFKPSQFPDKKKIDIEPSEFEQAVRRVAELKESASVGQKEAVWIPDLERPGKPMLFLFLTDTHYFSTKTRHDLLNYYLDTVKNTPNMKLVTGGDDVDAFNITLGKVASGVYENPFEVGFQSRNWAKKMKELDDMGKIGFMVFGNHTDWSFNAGIDWYDTYLGDFECPVLTTGGLVIVRLDKQIYKIAATHRYWGTSKLNPTNACKRYLEHEHPDADIVLLGHTHQSESLSFERGGKERIGIIGGTLKLYDDYARKHGIAGRSGTSGHCVSLWGDHNEMQAYKNFDRAVEEHLKRI
jgi:hypothetical protein